MRLSWDTAALLHSQPLSERGEQDTGYPKSTSKLIPLYFSRCKGWYKEINISSRCDDENLVHSQLVTNLWVSECVTDRNALSISEIAGIVVDMEYLLACKQLGSLFSSRHVSLLELFEWNWIRLVNQEKNREVTGWNQRGLNLSWQAVVCILGILI